MRQLSPELLAKAVSDARKEKRITQGDLSKATGINRSLLSRLETQTFTPSVNQLLAISDVLGFDITSVMIDDTGDDKRVFRGIPRMKIAIIGDGYVGISTAILLAQNHDVSIATTTDDIADKLNRFCSPICDDEIERFFSEVRNGERELSLSATTDRAVACGDADLVIIATPTGYDEDDRIFDTSSVELAIEQNMTANPDAMMVIMSTVPVGFTDRVCKKYNTENVIVSPEFLRESNALYDNLHPSRIVVGTYEHQKEVAEEFAELLLEGVRTEELCAGQKPQDIPVLIDNPSEAEAIKFFTNAYLAVRVSYFNEVDTYALCKGLDSKRIIDGVCKDCRIGDHYSNPSFGYGGFSLPKDSEHLLDDYTDIPQTLSEAVVKSNNERQDFIADQIIAMEPKVVGVYHLKHRSNSDNFCEPAVQSIMRRVKEKKIPIVVYEPELEEGSELFHGKVMNDLEWFKAQSDVILANRFDEKELGDVKEKVYTRDLFRRD